MLLFSVEARTSCRRPCSCRANGCSGRGRLVVARVRERRDGLSDFAELLIQATDLVQKPLITLGDRLGSELVQLVADRRRLVAGHALGRDAWNACTRAD